MHAVELKQADQRLKKSRRAAPALDAAVNFLQTELVQGPRLVKELRALAAQHGIGGDALKRAKSHLNIEPSQPKGCNAWLWSLPAGSVAPALPVDPPQHSDMAPPWQAAADFDELERLVYLHGDARMRDLMRRAVDDLDERDQHIDEMELRIANMQSDVLTEALVRELPTTVEDMAKLACRDALIEDITNRFHRGLTRQRNALNKLLKALDSGHRLAADDALERAQNLVDKQFDELNELRELCDFDALPTPYRRD